LDPEARKTAAAADEIHLKCMQTARLHIEKHQLAMLTKDVELIVIGRVRLLANMLNLEERQSQQKCSKLVDHKNPGTAVGLSQAIDVLALARGEARYERAG
jgi:hypothetical protein